MNVDRTIREGVRVAQKLLEVRYGPLPEFDVCPHSGQALGGPMLVFPDRRRRRFVIWYNPKFIENRYDYVARLWIDILHDVAHIYTMDPQRRASGMDWDDLRWPDEPRAYGPSDPQSAYQDWVEGGANLATFAVLQDLMLSNHLFEIAQEITGQEPGEAVNDLACAMAEALGHQLVAGVRSGLIASPNLQLLNLPFEVDPYVSQLIQDDMVPHYSALENVYETRLLPYVRGIHRLGRLISGGQLTEYQMLTEPQTNQRLAQLAG